MEIKRDDIFNQECEDNLIGIMLTDIDNEFNSRILSQIDKKDFYQTTHKIIFEAISELHKAKKPVDVVTVYELLKFNKQLELAGGTELINGLATNVITRSNYQQLIKILIKYSKKRAVISLCKSSLEDLDKCKDVDDVTNNIVKVSQEILNRTTTTNFQGLMSGVMEVMDNVEALIENKGNTLGLSTGFSELDNLLSGLCPGRLYLLGARPSMGKSALAQQITETVAQNKNVLFFSLEMSLEEYSQRSIYRRSGYNQEHLTRGIIPREQILEKFAEVSEELANLHLNIVDDAKTTLKTIERNIQECIVQFGSCDLVVVDYLQLMKSDNPKVIDDYAIVTDNSQGLKQLARKYKVPILALAQLSRQSELRQDKTPVLADLRDSGSLEQDADVVLFIHRPAVYNKTVSSYKELAQLIVAKNRQGPRGRIIPIVFNPKTAGFSEDKDDRKTIGNI